MPRRTMTVNRIWYHPLRKTSVEDWGQVGELPDGRDLVEVFVNFVQSDIDNDSLVREDRESYAVVTGVERKNRAVTAWATHAPTITSSIAAGAGISR